MTALREVRASHENFEAPLQKALPESYRHVMALYRVARIPLDRIGPWCDREAATLVSDEFPVDSDNYEQGLELAAVANLIDLSVHRIFSAEITSLQEPDEGR